MGENEAVKMIRVKEGLVKLGTAYCELAHKCLVIFSAHKDIASQLPDVHDRDLHGVKYTGVCVCVCVGVGMGVGVGVCEWNRIEHIYWLRLYNKYVPS